MCRDLFYRCHRHQLEIQPGDRVLEIGTGWGGFALHAARPYGCRVTTTTISREQHDLARQRVVDAGMHDRITLLLEDYRHFIDKPEMLITQLQVLHPFHGSKRLEHWNKLIRAGEFSALVEELLEFHYDPSYLSSQAKHYTKLEQAEHQALSDLSMEALMPVAKALHENLRGKR